jgi:hypothetical protein
MILQKNKNIAELIQVFRFFSVKKYRFAIFIKSQILERDEELLFRSTQKY